jgi:hypothetical protein
MRYVLNRFAYDDKDPEVVGRPDGLIVGRGMDLFEQDEDTEKAYPAL